MTETTLDDRARFRRLYDDNYERILGYALRRTVSADDAADVVAETFLAAWRRLGDVPSGDRARMWLYGTARRVLANHHRGRRRQDRLVDRVGTRLVPVDGAAPAVRDHPEADVITAAFAQLSDTDRDLLLLVGWEGLDHGQLAEVMGCRRATVRVRLHRARRRFARELEAAGLKRSETSGHDRDRWATTRPGTEEQL